MLHNKLSIMVDWHHSSTTIAAAIIKLTAFVVVHFGFRRISMEFPSRGVPVHCKYVQRVRVIAVKGSVPCIDNYDDSIGASGCYHGFHDDDDDGIDTLGFPFHNRCSLLKRSSVRCVYCIWGIWLWRCHQSKAGIQCEPRPFRVCRSVWSNQNTLSPWYVVSDDVMQSKRTDSLRVSVCTRLYMVYGEVSVWLVCIFSRWESILSMCVSTNCVCTNSVRFEVYFWLFFANGPLDSIPVQQRKYWLGQW